MCDSCPPISPLPLCTYLAFLDDTLTSCLPFSSFPCSQASAVVQGVDYNSSASWALVLPPSLLHSAYSMKGRVHSVVLWVGIPPNASSFHLTAQLFLHGSTRGENCQTGNRHVDNRHADNCHADQGQAESSQSLGPLNLGWHSWVKPLQV